MNRISIFCFFLLLSSLTLPWWKHASFQNVREPVSTQTIQLLPPLLRIDSSRNVVTRELSLTGKLRVIGFVTLSLVITSLFIQTFNNVISQNSQRLLKKDLEIISGIISFIACSFFIISMDIYLTSGSLTMGLFGNYGLDKPPLGYSTRWGLSYGFYASLTSCIILELKALSSNYKA
jgi:hypothetical protein